MEGQCGWKLFKKVINKTMMGVRICCHINENPSKRKILVHLAAMTKWEIDEVTL